MLNESYEKINIFLNLPKKINENVSIIDIYIIERTKGNAWLQLKLKSAKKP